MTAPFDVCGPLPDRRDRARGERRHRQDVHDRRARGALRRRGHAARASCCSSRSRAWRPASCASACASGSSHAERALARALAARRRATTRSCGCWRRRAATRSRRAATRLARALADFDAATIATTHGFCQEVLGGLGIAGDVEPRRDVRRGRRATCVDEVVDDLYVRRFHGARRRRRSPAPRRRAIARARGRQPGRADRAAPTRRRRAPAMRARLARRRRARSSSGASGALGRHDLRRPAHAPRRDARGPGRRRRSRARLRARYRVVLVDEFQDTDPVQWEHHARARSRGGATLVLIGDPKQAIYAFRGADVYAYLDAARERRRAGDARRQLAQRPGR